MSDVAHPTQTGSFAQAEADDSQTRALVEEIAAGFSDALLAIYRYGSTFARGAEAPAFRLLVLVREIDPKVLDTAASLAEAARTRGGVLRLDTPIDIIDSADCFPVFALELLE